MCVGIQIGDRLALDGIEPWYTGAMGSGRHLGLWVLAGAFGERFALWFRL